MLSGNQLSWNSIGPTPTRTPTPTLGMRLSCNFVNVYTIAYRVRYNTRVHARIPNGHPREDPWEENRAACRTSRRGCPCRCRRRGMPALGIWLFFVRSQQVIHRRPLIGGLTTCSAWGHGSALNDVTVTSAMTPRFRGRFCRDGNFWPNAQIGLGLVGSVALGLGLYSGLSGTEVRWHAVCLAENANPDDVLSMQIPAADRK